MDGRILGDPHGSGLGPRNVTFFTIVEPGGGSLPGQRHLSLQPNRQSPDGPKALFFFQYFRAQDGVLCPARDTSLSSADQVVRVPSPDLRKPTGHAIL